MLQTVFCSWTKFSGDMNFPSAPSTTKQQLFAPSVVLKLMTPIICCFTNMPCDLIMIQALTHFLYECCLFNPNTFSDVSYKECLFISCSFYHEDDRMNHGIVLKTEQIIEVKENGKRLVDD